MNGPRGLALGLDLPWMGPHGIVDDRVAERTLAFLRAHGHRFVSLFVSWQPRDRGVPAADVVIPAWDELFATMPHAARCLHQTAFNLAGTRYDRTALVRMTNALVERYGFQWINEDLGHWSAGGWPLPYPVAPALTAEAVDRCAAACAEVQAGLDVPLVVEFPGFEGRPHGPLDAYDAFRQVVERSGCPCNLDTGHLLTWRWVAGHRGEALLDGLDRLPLDRCVELHCAGVTLTGERLIDAHDGVLHPVQLELARRLMALCPDLRLVTFEDPRFDAEGRMPEPVAGSLDALDGLVGAWLDATVRPTSPVQVRPSDVDAGPWSDADEQELRAEFLRDSENGRRCRRQVLDRAARGIGRPSEVYAAQLPPDARIDGWLKDFLGSAEGRGWSEFAWAVPGRALEDALGRFLGGGDAHLLACAKLLATHPDPPFVVPDGFQRAPRGWFVVGGPPGSPVLMAALDGRLVTGPITPLVARLLGGEQVPGAQTVVAELQRLGLLN